MVDFFSSFPGVIVFVVVMLILGSAALAGFQAAPWVPTRGRDVHRMLDLAELRPDECMLDLGAGDGRFLLIAAQEYQARAIGYEYSIGPWVVAQARLLFAGLRSRAKLRFGDFTRVSWAEADVITCFLTPKAMPKLESKFLRDAKPGARFVSYAFPFPKLQPIRVSKPDPRLAAVYLYRAPGGNSWRT